MDFKSRALYYLIDCGADSPDDSADRFLSLGLDVDHFRKYDKTPGVCTWVDTAESQLFTLSTEFLNKHHARIPIDTLSAQAETIADPSLKEYALACVRGLRSQTGDGSDIPAIFTELSIAYQKGLLRSTLMRVIGLVKADENPKQSELVIQEYLEKVEETRRGKDDLVYTFGSSSGAHVVDYLTREQDENAGVGIPTGLPPFDLVTGGIKRGEVAIVCAGTKKGKTSLCGTIASNAFLLGANVACAGKEMYGSSIRRRMEAGMLLAEVHGCTITRGKSGLEDGLVRAMERGELPEKFKQNFIELQTYFSDEEENDHRMWIFEPGSYTNLKDLSTQIGYTKRKYGLDLLWIDSINIQSVGGKADERHDLQQGGVVSALKDIAITHDIAILGDAQERPQTVDKRNASKEEFVMFSTSITQRLDHLIRTYMPPGRPELREIQHHCARGSALVDPFFMFFYDKDMSFNMAPKNVYDGTSEPREWGSAVDGDDEL